MRPSGTDTSLPEACRWEPGKTGRSQQRMKILTKVSLSDLHGAWSREEGKILCCLFLFKLGLAGKKRKRERKRNLVIDPSSPRVSYCCFVCFHLCSENLVWQISGWGLQKYGQIEVWVAFHLLLGSCCHPWGRLEFDVTPMAGGRERDNDGTNV